MNTAHRTSPHNVQEVMAHYAPLPTLTGKINEYGPKALSDAELLSVFFSCSVESATTMLQQFGSLRPVMAGDQRLTQEQSLKAKVATELLQRNFKQQLKHGDVLEDPDAVRFYLASKLRERQSEVFAVIFLDNRHRVIEYKEMFFGTIDGASVYPREVVKEALHQNAAAVLFAHNHPSQCAEPSQSDERITQRLRDALALIDVRVLDHFVVGDEIVSMLERGLL